MEGQPSRERPGDGLRRELVEERIAFLLRAVRDHFDADWVVLWIPVFPTDGPPCSRAAYEARRESLPPVIGFAVPVVGDAWTDLSREHGYLYSTDVMSDPRLVTHRGPLERLGIQSMANSSYAPEGVTLCAVDVYVRGPPKLTADSEPTLRHAASEAYRLIRQLEGDHAAQKPAVPSDPLLRSTLHDLRNALAAQSLVIAGMGREVAALGRAGSRIEEAVASLRVSLEVLRDTSAHAIELARVMAVGASAPGETVTISIRGLIQLALAVVPTDLRDRFDIVCDPECDRQRTIREASSWLRVLANLVQNATRAITSKLGARAVLRSRLENQWVVLEVEDDGPGVPPDTLDRLFEPGATTRTDHPGHGYGLHSARSLVLSLGGTLNLYNQPGHGARFTIRVPIAQTAVVG